MLRGPTPRAEEMAGTAVLRIVVSSDSMKKATATSHGKRRLEVSEGTHEDGGALNGPHGVVGRRLREVSSATHSRSVQKFERSDRRMRKPAARCPTTIGQPVYSAAM